MKHASLAAFIAITLSSCATAPDTTRTYISREPIDTVYYKRCMAFMERGVIGALRKHSGRDPSPSWQGDVVAANDCTAAPLEQLHTAEQILRFREAVRMFKLGMETPSASTVAEFVKAETFFNATLPMASGP